MRKAGKSPIWQISDKKFSHLISNSKTFSEALKYFGLKNHGSNHETLKKRIRLLNLDVNHFYDNALKCRRKPKKLSMDKILVENSTFYRGHLKRRIIKEKLLEYTCAICGNIGRWNNDPLVLVLDHINGINNDHRLENLRFLCPNCNSQQKTFCGRNNNYINDKYGCASRIYGDSKKYTYKGDKCINCNNDIVYTSKTKLCHKCVSTSRRKVPRPSYDQLQQDMRSMSMVKVGKKYGVSDNAVRKWLKQYKKEGSLSNQS